jgi:hypothetical protein
MDELLERLDAATASDRDIDAAIALTVAGWSFEKRPGDRREYWRSPDDISAYSSYQPRRDLPRFTGSTDDAVELIERRLGFDAIPDTMRAALDDLGRRYFWHIRQRKRQQVKELPVALCRALVRQLVKAKAPA